MSAMTNEQKLREIAKRYGGSIVVGYGQPSGSGSQLVVTAEEQLFSDLTALISEGYVSKEEHDKALQQRDELREALLNLWSWVHQIDDWSGVGDPPIERIEAAIKNTER